MTRAAVVLAVALILAALVHGGIYGMVVAGSGGGGSSGGSHDLTGDPGERGEVKAYLFNRFTGSVAECRTRPEVVCARSLWGRLTRDGVRLDGE